MVKQSKYNSLNEWRKFKPNDFNRAKRLGVLDEIANIFGWKLYKKNLGKNHWTKERVIEDAKNYTKKVVWMKTSSSAYSKALNRGWMEEATAHMIKNKPSGYWNLKENVINEAKKHFNIKEWSESSKVSYNKALNRGWLDEATQHMEYYSRNNLDK